MVGFYWCRGDWVAYPRGHVFEISVNKKAIKTFSLNRFFIGGPAWALFSKVNYQNYQEHQRSTKSHKNITG